MPMLPRRRFALAWMLALFASLSITLTGCGGSDPSTDIAITAAGPDQTVPPGGVAAFTMTVTNNGPDGADGVRVENLLDSRLTLVEILCSASGGATCPASPALGMTLPHLPAGSVLTFTVRASVPASGVVGLIINSMGTRSLPEDPDLGNNTALASAVVGTAEVRAAYFVSDVVVAGTTANFIASVINAGPGSTHNAQLSYTLPPNYVASEVLCEAFEGATCPADLRANPMTIAELPAGGNLKFQIKVPVPPEARGDLSSTLSLSAGGDGNPDNNTATATATLSAATANLAVTHSVSAGTVAGTDARFTGVVVNSGPNDSRNVVLRFTAPEGHGVGTVSCLAAGGAVCPAGLGASMDVPLIPLGGSLRFVFPVPVGPAESGELTAVFQATADGDPASEDNTRATTTTVVAPNADLGVKHLVLSQVAAGAQASFTASVTNFGPDTARQVRLTYSLADGYSADSFSCTAVGGAACPAQPSGSMLIDEMPAGSTIRLNVLVTARSSGSIRATIAASSAGDPQPGNDSLEAVATIVAPPARLSVSHFAPAAAAIGGSTTFTASVTNGGPNAATQVRLTQALQTAGYAIASVSCTPSAGAACPTLPPAGAASHVVDLASLAAGATLQLRYTVDVPAGAVEGSSITARFSASADGDPAVDDNVADASTTVAASTANLAVSHSVAPSTPQGQDAGFIGVVANLGSSTARNVTLTFVTTPANQPFTASCSATGGAACPGSLADPVASLPVGGSLRWVVSVPTAALGVGAALDATFSASYSGDPDPSNNSATASTLVSAPADPRNGDYKVFGADGRRYTLSLDYGTSRYTLAGNGLLREGSFSASGDGGFQVDARQRWRHGSDLLVGGLDFGAGVLPFVGARSFVGSVGELPSGDVNLLGRLVDATTAVTRANGARWSPGVMELCTSDAFYRVATCPAEDLKRYALSVNAAGLFTALEVATGQTFDFYVARSGAEIVLLRTGGSSTRLFQVGLLDNTGPSGGVVQGATTGGAWGTSTLSATSYQFSGQDAAGPVARSATLVPGAANGPIGVRVGDRAPDGARIFVIQRPVLSVVAGARVQADTSPGLANGEIELGAP